MTLSYDKACKLAEHVEPMYDNEPTRGVLIVNAAKIATALYEIDITKPNEACDLIRRALQNPELREQERVEYEQLLVEINNNNIMS